MSGQGHLKTPRTLRWTLHHNEAVNPRDLGLVQYGYKIWICKVVNQESVVQSMVNLVQDWCEFWFHFIIVRYQWRFPLYCFHFSLILTNLNGMQNNSSEKTLSYRRNDIIQSWINVNLLLNNQALVVTAFYPSLSHGQGYNKWTLHL